MPARKPQDLHTRHSTKAEIDARANEEDSMKSARPVPVEPPARLGGNKIAMATWRRLIREYSGVEAEIISRLDMDLLADYCQVTAQQVEVDKMRAIAHDVWLGLADKHTELKDTGDKDAALAMALQVGKAFDNLIKLDARADAKRKLLVTMRQSLYLTPRARAGVAPKGKEEESPVDPFDQLLNEAAYRLENKNHGGTGEIE